LQRQKEKADIKATKQYYNLNCNSHNLI
jgi:hypothetical protein